ncbi:MAG: 4Fe-4S dicluster domain-containing protein [bacterium]
MNKILAINPDKCTNCKMCELACSMVKIGEFNPARSRIRVNAFPEDFAYIPLACFQCADAPCAKVCPAGALVGEPGLVRFDPDACIGCKMCILACPFGVISFDVSKGIIAKCDACDGDPECVRFCTPGAIEFKEADFVALSRERDFARRIAGASRG